MEYALTLFVLISLVVAYNCGLQFEVRRGILIGAIFGLIMFAIVVVDKYNLIEPPVIIDGPIEIPPGGLIGDEN